MRGVTVGIFFMLVTTIGVAQTQTTGGISGTVSDENGALIPGASITIVSSGTGESRALSTDASGLFTASLLSAGIFELRVQAPGFRLFRAGPIVVNLTETTFVNVRLTVASVVVDPVSIEGSGSIAGTDKPTLGKTIDARAIAELPLPTRTFTQLLALVPGTSTYLNDPTGVGRNAQATSVNGARPTQNSVQVNGVDINAGIMRDLQMGDPAPESLAQVTVQTSLYDASFGRAGGGNVQVVTKSGSNDFHGIVYEYFGDTALNANNPFLKAAAQRRPALSRNVYGVTLGGPVKRDRAFFFASFQGTREQNAASHTHSVRTGVFIAENLTDDRSSATLMKTFPGIHSISLELLQSRLPDGRFVIPTPGENGQANFAEMSRYKEEQFNTNLDLRLSQKNWLAIKFFWSNTPLDYAFVGAVVPGFGEKRKRNNAIVSIQDIHTFSGNFTNEARIGYNFIGDKELLAQPLLDSDIGIYRSTAAASPGLPNMSLGGFSIGGAPRQDDVTAPSASVSETVSVQSGLHAVKIGGAIRYSEYNIRTNAFTRGIANFVNFENFIAGTVAGFSFLGNGIPDRALRTTDYNLFVHDDWRVSPKLTLSLGFRYELDLPPYDTRGRISTFDPQLYEPLMETDGNGNPLGPPIRGFVQAGNVIAAYDHRDVENVGSRVLHSIDPNNFAPRVGLAWSPLKSDRIVFRSGYGIYYSRVSFQYTIATMFTPPMYYVAGDQGRSIDDPFPTVPALGEFPGVFTGPPLAGTVFDRNLRTPYIQQFNGSVLIGLSPDTLFEAAYVGTRSLNLLRQFGINQAYLASETHPVRNVVTGTDYTTNTPQNAQLRAPFQGVFVNAFFSQIQAAGQSNYHSLQTSLSRRFSRGLQLLAAYTFSKSMDNGSGVGGGAGVGGVLDTDFINDSSFPDGDQRDNRSARGVSDFDRTHRLVVSGVWEVPAAKKGPAGIRKVLSGWQLSGVLTWMSGLPINIRDGRSAELFFGPNGGGDRPSWAPGATAATAMTNIPFGYYFNPFAFVRSVVTAGQLIPSSHDGAVAGPGCPVIGNAFCTDFGNVGRNPLRGPRQFNVDVALTKRIKFSDARSLDLRAEAFNLLNNVNFANPISNFNATTNGGAIDNTTGQITSLGGFGKIIRTSNNPRVVQLVFKFHF